MTATHLSSAALSWVGSANPEGGQTQAEVPVSASAQFAKSRRDAGFEKSPKNLLKASSFRGSRVELRLRHDNRASGSQRSRDTSAIFTGIRISDLHSDTTSDTPRSRRSADDQTSELQQPSSSFTSTPYRSQTQRREKPRKGDAGQGVDELWERVKTEAREDSNAEPALASYLYSTILAHKSLDRALAFHLGNKLASSTLLSTHLVQLISDSLDEDPSIRYAVRADMCAVKEKDPACRNYSHCLLNFKGFLACQAHRISHRLWKQGRYALALAIHSRVSEVFHVDIHPAAVIGHGVLFDHATGLVIGETAVVGNNVSILHHVTLGGTGVGIGKRHPTIEDGVLIGAGTTILGPLVVGEGAKIGAGSVVLNDIPPHTTAVGSPAKLLGGKQHPKMLAETPSETMDHTSFISEWSDYAI